MLQDIYFGTDNSRRVSIVTEEMAAGHHHHKTPSLSTLSTHYLYTIYTPHSPHVPAVTGTVCQGKLVTVVTGELLVTEYDEVTHRHWAVITLCVLHHCHPAHRYQSDTITVLIIHFCPRPWLIRSWLDNPSFVTYHVRVDIYISTIHRHRHMTSWHSLREHCDQCAAPT